MSVNDLTVEVCVDSMDSAIAAERGGANRLELCGSLVEGGVTPSAGLIATARQKISIGLHVMIRPRAGDFYYSADEFEVMRRDVLMASAADAYGTRVAGMVLTGANDDGAEGLLAIHRAGGLTAVQSPDEAQVDTMPLAAIARHTPNYVLSLRALRTLLLQLDSRHAP